MERSLNCSRLVTVSPHLKKKHTYVSLMKKILEINVNLHFLASSNFLVDACLLLINLVLVITIKPFDAYDKGAFWGFTLMF